MILHDITWHHNIILHWIILHCLILYHFMYARISKEFIKPQCLKQIQAQWHAIAALQLRIPWLQSVRRNQDWWIYERNGMDVSQQKMQTSSLQIAEDLRSKATAFSVEPGQHVGEVRFAWPKNQYTGIEVEASIIFVVICKHPGYKLGRFLNFRLSQDEPIFTCDIERISHSQGRSAKFISLAWSCVVADFTSPTLTGRHSSKPG